MDKGQLIIELNKVLFFEHGHLSLYEGQQKIVKDQSISDVFNRFYQLEEVHTQKVVAVLKDLGEKPMNIYKVSDFLGEVAGITSKVIGTENILKADISVESKAMEGYKKLLETIGDEALKQRLKENMIDSSLMYSWLKTKLDQLQTLNRPMI